MNAIICATRYYHPFSTAHKGNDALFVEVIWQMVGLSLGIMSALVKVGGLHRLQLYLLLTFKLIYTIKGFVMTLSYRYHCILLIFDLSYWLPPFSMLPFSSCKVCWFCFCFDTGSHSVSQASLILPVLGSHRHKPPWAVQTVNITW